jgi:hypothetical protein
MAGRKTGMKRGGGRGRGYGHESKGKRKMYVHGEEKIPESAIDHQDDSSAFFPSVIT